MDLTLKFSILLLLLGFANASPFRNDFGHCERVVKKWASSSLEQEEYEDDERDEKDESDPNPEDFEYVGQIKRVLELLRKNRDMIFSDVKLTVMIEDLREVERRRLLGIEDPDAPTREELADVHEEFTAARVSTRTSPWSVKSRPNNSSPAASISASLLSSPI